MTQRLARLGSTFRETPTWAAKTSCEVVAQTTESQDVPARVGGGSSPAAGLGAPERSRSRSGSFYARLSPLTPRDATARARETTNAWAQGHAQRLDSPHRGMCGY